MASNVKDYVSQKWQAGSKLYASQLTDMSATLAEVEEMAYGQKDQIAALEEKAAAEEHARALVDGQLSDRIAEVEAKIPTIPDHTGFATRDDLDALEAKIPEIPSHDEYALKSEAVMFDVRGDRSHVVLPNHTNILGKGTDGIEYNVAMVSKWDVADYGSPALHMNINSKDDVTLNDKDHIATKEWVEEQKFMVDDVEDKFAKMSDVTEAVAAKVDAEFVAAEIAKVSHDAYATVESVTAVADELSSHKKVYEEVVTTVQTSVLSMGERVSALESATTLEDAKAYADQQVAGVVKYDDTGFMAVQGEIANIKSDIDALPNTYMAKEAAADFLTKDAADTKYASNDSVRSLAENMENFVSPAISGYDPEEGSAFEQIKDLAASVSTLVGDDVNKSARSIAAEEVAKVVADAPEDFDTLKEVADWIKSDTTGAAKLQADVANIKTTVDALPTEFVSKEDFDYEVNGLGNLVTSAWNATGENRNSIERLNGELVEAKTDFADKVARIEGIIGEDLADTGLLGDRNYLYTKVDELERKFGDYATNADLEAATGTHFVAEFEPLKDKVDELDNTVYSVQNDVIQNSNCIQDLWNWIDGDYQSDHKNLTDSISAFEEFKEDSDTYFAAKDHTHDEYALKEDVATPGDIEGVYDELRHNYAEKGDLANIMSTAEEARDTANGFAGQINDLIDRVCDLETNDTKYDDTALAARVSALETDAAKHHQEIESNQTDIHALQKQFAEMAAEIAALRTALAASTSMGTKRVMDAGIEGVVVDPSVKVDEIVCKNISESSEIVNNTVAGKLVVVTGASAEQLVFEII